MLSYLISLGSLFTGSVCQTLQLPLSRACIPRTMTIQVKVDILMISVFIGSNSI